MKQALAIVLLLIVLLGCGGAGSRTKPQTAPAQLTDQLVEDLLKDYKPAGLTSTTVGVEKTAVAISATVADDTNADAWKTMAKGIIDHLRSTLPKDHDPIIMVQVYHKQSRVAVGIAAKGQSGAEMKFKVSP